MFYIIDNNNVMIAINETALIGYGCEIKKLPDDYEEGKYIVVDNELVLNPNWEEEQAQKERKTLNMLSLTKREVFLALHKDKGITPKQLRSQITDEEALIEFDYANDYYRGNPLIDKIGIMLGYSTEDLDYLFKNKELPAVETVNGSNGGEG